MPWETPQVENECNSFTLNTSRNLQPKLTLEVLQRTHTMEQGLWMWKTLTLDKVK